MTSTEPADKDNLTLTGTARISDVFNLTGRGLAIVLDDDVSGQIVGPTGVMKSIAGFSDFLGPEFVDGKSYSALAVVATAPNATSMFSPGDLVEFFSFRAEG